MAKLGGDFYDNIDEMDLVIDYIESNPSEFIDLEPFKVPKFYPPKKDYWQTPWRK